MKYIKNKYFPSDDGSVLDTLSAMANVCFDEVLKPTYIKKIPVNAIPRYLISRVIGRSKRYPDYRYFWTTAILLEAIEEYFIVFQHKRCALVVEEFFIKSNAMAGYKKPLYVDEAMNSFSLFFLKEHLKNYWCEEDIKKTANFLTSVHAKSNNGIMPYRQPKRNIIYVDTIAMACPFLSRYSYEYNDPSSMNLAILQIKDFFLNGMCEYSGLPFHGYNSLTNKKIGNVGWGRGTGWLLLGLIGVLRYLPLDHSEFGFLIDRFRSLIVNVSNFQTDNGGFFVALDGRSDTRIDSGATALIGYVIAKGIQIGILNKSLLVNAEGAFKYVLSVTECNGRVLECSGESGGAGKYSADFGWYPWGQGPSVALGSVLISIKNNRE